MVEELNTKTTKELFSGSSSLSSLPNLSNELTSLYGVLDDNMKQIFIKLFRWCYRQAVSKQSYFKRGATLYYYYLVERSRMNNNLTTSELSALTFLYHESKQGSCMVHSKLITLSSLILPRLTFISRQGVLNDLKHKGYITRHTRNPGISSHLKCSHSVNPVFISLTRSGVNLIEGIEKDIYKMLLNTSLNDLTGAIKKP
jgi:hypothetical protein